MSHWSRGTELDRQVLGQSVGYTAADVDQWARASDSDKYLIRLHNGDRWSVSGAEVHRQLLMDGVKWDGIGATARL